MKKNLLIIIGIFIVIMQIVVISIIYINDEKTIVKEDYIAVFKGETGETVHSTYVYKVKNKNKKISYKYINTISTTDGYDSSNWNETILKKGKTKKVKEIYKIAEKNEAYSYVKNIEDDEIYSIDDYKKIFK